MVSPIGTSQIIRYTKRVLHALDKIHVICRSYSTVTVELAYFVTTFISFSIINPKYGKVTVTVHHDERYFNKILKPPGG